MAVIQACLSMDLGVRRQGSPVEVNGVAVLNCCTSRLCELNAQIVESAMQGKSWSVSTSWTRGYRPFMHPSRAASPSFIWSTAAGVIAWATKRTNRSHRTAPWRTQRSPSS